MTEQQSAAEPHHPDKTHPAQPHPDQPHHMAQSDSEARPTTPEVPPVPGADVDPDALEAGADHQPGAPAKQEEGDPAPTGAPADGVTSPELEHLDKTIQQARAAADVALTPQGE